MKRKKLDGTVVYNCDGECAGYYEKEDMVKIKINNHTWQICHWCGRDGKY